MTLRELNAEQFQKKIKLSTSHRLGTLPSPAAATELMLLRRISCCAQLASPLEVPPGPSSRCCWQHLEEGHDEDDQLSARL